MEQKSSVVSEEKVKGSSGLNIFFRSWRPKEKARALLVIVPGFNAHSGYYGLIG
jgi:acylglycerol lipase